MAPQFLFWEYLFQDFGIGSLRCGGAIGSSQQWGQQMCMLGQVASVTQLDNRHTDMTGKTYHVGVTNVSDLRMLVL